MATNRVQSGQANQGQLGSGWWWKHAAIAGVIAGIVFAMFEMIMAALLKGAFFGPLRMISAIVLGPAAITPDYPAVTAIVVGIVVHMVLSIIFGIVFAAIVSFVPQLARSTTVLLVTASIFGLALWLVNFYVLAPVFGWNWFPTQTNPIVQFFAHTFFFGTVLGWYLSRGSAINTAHM